MRELNVNLPCGKQLRFFMSEDQKVHCTHPQVITILSDQGVFHVNGNRYFPDDGDGRRASFRVPFASPR